MRNDRRANLYFIAFKYWRKKNWAAFYAKEKEILLGLQQSKGKQIPIEMNSKGPSIEVAWLIYVSKFFKI